MSIVVDDMSDEVLATTVSDEGVWEGKLGYRTYLGVGYQLEITSSGGESIVLNDVAFGEVWVCSGQSNMEWKIKGVR